MTLWFHTASVGEFNTVRPLLRELIKDYPILLTYFSPRAKEYLKTQSHYYTKLERLPIDTPFHVRAFVERHKPKALFIVDRELWPSLILFTKIPKALINAYAKGGLYERFITKRFNLIITRTEKDKERFLSYGCKRVVSCGNLKFVFDEREKRVLGIDKKDAKFLVAGSTHQGEEEVILNVFYELKREISELKLLIAPRHISRAREVCQKVKGYSCALRSESKEDWDVLVIDTLGELFDFYSLGDVVFVGGTLVPIGGHNLLEPVYHQKPVVFGKHIHKVWDVASYLIERNAGFMAKTPEELREVMRKLLTGELKFTKLNLAEESRKIKECYLRHIKGLLLHSEGSF